MGGRVRREKWEVRRREEWVRNIKKNKRKVDGGLVPLNTRERSQPQARKLAAEQSKRT